MTEIEVSATAVPGGWSCAVTVRTDAATTEHLVRVRDADLARLAPGAGDPVDLVRRSIEFLLEREPATSILYTFDLPAVSRYFPEFERAISDR